MSYGDKADRIIADLQDENARLRHEHAAQVTLRRQDESRHLDTIAKVRELHQPFEWSFGYGPVTSCKGCADQGVPQENASWPCPTIQAIGEEPNAG